MTKANRPIDLVEQEQGLYQIHLNMSTKFSVQKRPYIIRTRDITSNPQHFYKATDDSENLSIASMIAPPKWSEPAQVLEFE